MYTTAPNYLSGVSVFLGDDISKRVITGEVAFFIGQAVQGPTVPVVLSSIDAAISLYGKNSPLLKGLYEFNDGYIDSPRANTLQLVTLRVGGVRASLTTTFGVTIETSDAYDAIEDDFYIYINNNTGALNIKAWNKSGSKVLDTANGINGGYLTIFGSLTGTGGILGKDIDADPFDLRYTLRTALDPSASITSSNAVKIGSVTTTGVTYNSNTLKTTIELTLTDSQLGQYINPKGGWITIKSVNAALSNTQILKYESATIVGSDVKIVINGEVTVQQTPWVNNIYVSLFDLTLGDSELTSDPRKKYEMFRNSLMSIEQYAPDYIVPCGIAFNETDIFSKLIQFNTSLVTEVLQGDTSITVEGAANWLASGNVDLFDGSFKDELVYSSRTLNGSDYTIKIDYPTNLTINSDAVSGADTFTVTGPTVELEKLRSSGYLLVGGNKVKYIACIVSGTVATLTRDIVNGFGGSLNSATPVTKVVGATGPSYTGYIVTHSYYKQTSRELGIGYVKETDIGGQISFEWSDTIKAGFGLAHFGYLLAKFCSDATIGENTPLCGMNVDITKLAANNYSRADIIQWIGTYPSYVNVPGQVDVYSGILASGSGLLGDPVMAGSVNYNRSGLTDAQNGIYVDPGLGLLLTAEGFIDGTIARDNFGNLVDLGKYLVVGAGLLNFNNGASISTYIDACGIYSLGMLSGKPQSEGLSFSRIGTVSNTSVGVVVHRKYYNDLAHKKFIVVTRERGLGWVINNADSAARTDSEYKLISTTRTIKYIVEAKRTLLASFIGKPLNTYAYESAKTKLADSFRNDIKNGLLNAYNFDLQIENVAAAIGKLYLKISINPPFELTQVTIDTIIDRTVTNTQ
jgi:hypothetical protein